MVDPGRLGILAAYLRREARRKPVLELLPRRLGCFT